MGFYHFRLLISKLLWACFPLFSLSQHPESLSATGLTARDFANHLCREILTSEDHPVITRFWLFGSAVRRMLTTALVSSPGDIFMLGSTQPMAKQQHRLTMVRKFFADESQVRQLKISVLCLQLTHVMLAITAKKTGTDSPVLMRLSQSTVETGTGQVLVRILKALGADSDIDRVLVVDLGDHWWCHL